MIFKHEDTEKNSTHAYLYSHESGLVGRFAVPGSDTTVTVAAAVAAMIGTFCVATADLRTAGEPPCDVRMLLYIPFGSLGRRKSSVQVVSVAAA